MNILIKLSDRQRRQTVAVNAYIKRHKNKSITVDIIRIFCFNLYIKINFGLSDSCKCGHSLKAVF